MIRKLYQGPMRTEKRRNYFGNRIIDVWNALPYAIVGCPTISAFRRSLLAVNLTKFLKQDFDDSVESCYVCNLTVCRLYLYCACTCLHVIQCVVFQFDYII